MREMFRIKGESVASLTSSSCRGCDGISFSSSFSQSGSDSDRILSSLLQTCQYVHCPTNTRYGVRVSETVCVVSVGVGDGVASS